MKHYFILFNPKACSGKGESAAHRLDALYPSSSLTYLDMTGGINYEDFFADLPEEDTVIVCGGDGTLNRFVNDTEGICGSRPIWYYACGTGNDFLRDLGEDGSKPVEVTKYIEDLLLATVSGKSYRFFNNVGFGIDGYCCEKGDEQRAAGRKDINYTKIALGGLLGGFSPVTATVTVDGKTKRYRSAWLAPTMKGRYYGGGMMAAPKQDRLSPDRECSLMVYHGSGRARILTVFPSIFMGEHVKHESMVEIRTGHDFHVVFDRPCALQIDGETFLGVTEYEVHCAQL